MDKSNVELQVRQRLQFALQMSSPPTSSGAFWRRPLRYLWRVPLLLLHLLVAIPVALLVQSRWASRRRRGDEPLNLWLVRWWTRSMLHIIGIRPRCIGTPLQDPVMFVANHVSWLDIELLHSQRAACFVAKAEINRWPVIGWLARYSGTIFHRRGDPESMARVVATMSERLQQGRAVAAFPEGSTGSMNQVRTFHARIFQAALDADVPIQPVALRYCRDGVTWDGVAFGRYETFFTNVWRLIGEPPTDAEVYFLRPLDTQIRARKTLAVAARQQVAQALGLA